jgi:hypothetical protein
MVYCKEGDLIELILQGVSPLGVREWSGCTCNGLLHLTPRKRRHMQMTKRALPRKTHALAW